MTEMVKEREEQVWGEGRELSLGYAESEIPLRKPALATCKEMGREPAAGSRSPTTHLLALRVRGGMI